MFWVAAPVDAEADGFSPGFFGGMAPPPSFLAIIRIEILQSAFACLPEATEPVLWVAAPVDAEADGFSPGFFGGMAPPPSFLAIIRIGILQSAFACLPEATEPVLWVAAPVDAEADGFSPGFFGGMAPPPSFLAIIRIGILQSAFACLPEATEPCCGLQLLLMPKLTVSRQVSLEGWLLRHLS